MTPSETRTHLRLLDLRQRLPSDCPFTTAYALERGISYAMLKALVDTGLLVHAVRGVYHHADLPDCLGLRVAALKLVVPRNAVVTDRSAAWLLEAKRVLAPGAHQDVPPVQMFCPPGNRLRNALVASGERGLAPRDVESIDGLRVTTPLRTACDAGRLLHRDQAIGVMDALAAVGGFSIADLTRELGRFKGYRGVVQLRELAPLIDPMSESPGESTLRLRWLDLDLPRPTSQVEVPSWTGGSFFIDLGYPQARLGAEYFGEEFHGDAEAAYDSNRLRWLREELGWVIVVARKDNVYGLGQDIDGLLLDAARAAGVFDNPGGVA